MAPRNPLPSAPVEPTAEQLEAQRHAAQVQQRQALRDAQNANAHDNRLARLARKDPVIRELVDRYRAFDATLASLRDELTATKTWLDSARADARQAREDLDNQNAELVKLREQLAQALKPKK